MRKITIAFTLFIGAATCLTGCTSQLFIDATLPPAVEVTNQQWKVVAINRFNPDLLAYKREKKQEVYRQGADQAFAGALEAIQHDDTYQLVAADTLFKFSDNSLKEPFHPDQVKSVYTKYPHHLLLTLDNFDAYFEQETVREKDDNGNVNKTALYTLITTSDWTFYDSTGLVLDQIQLMQKQLYDSRSVLSGLLAIGPSMGNAGEMVNSLARQTGRNYWSRLSPKQISIVRPYYSMKNFQPAAIQMAARNWDEAITLLEPIAGSKKRKDAGKAAYNLAVVHEAKGDIKGAKKWARQAADNGNKLATLLLPNLQNYSTDF
ncbi:DUF6340 family protein [Pontibacter sp. MBLB2868]|uniref:DUF6340 family protein n=1 Tax=Pontibacter sp. MBLB2868 TaxID=3451555 RepID=UPI003F754E85